MNQELTPEQQGIVEKAAKEYAKTTLANVPIGAPMTFVQEDKFNGFKAGVTFALSSPDLMRGVLEGFAEAVNKRAFYMTYKNSDQYITDFIEYLKQKP